MSASIHVVRPGLQSTVQDEGRWGFQARGVPVGGPMDPFAHRLANALVGNVRTAATLEITLIGPELEFDDERVVAVAGGEFVLTVDGKSVPHGQPFVVSHGGVLKFGERRQGARAYIAVDGGIDVPPLLGSRSTHLPSAMGGYSGRALVHGDRLPLAPPHSQRTLASPRRAVLAPDTTNIVRVRRGPDLHRFADDTLERLQSGPYTIAKESDRMGFRLDGPALAHTRGPDIISDATPMGCLQVPGSGQPVLLMADCQTTGGYTRLATVIRADVGIAAQAAPGDTLSFRVCSPTEAIAALLAAEQRLLAFEAD